MRKEVAKDRRISIKDAHMRHGRKSRSLCVDGDTRHVVRDLDTGLVPAMGITPANAAEATITEAIKADLAYQQVVLGRVYEKPSQVTIHCSVS